MAPLLLLAASACLAAVKIVAVPPLPASPIAGASAPRLTIGSPVPQTPSALRIGASVLPDPKQSLELSSLNHAIRVDGAGKV
ncbi:MAG: hypothetical protein HY925_01925, partial [Elusimicrobia bacterium]|nr:hypothetical protein [Elusimicrobiota bacterium]